LLHPEDPISFFGKVGLLFLDCYTEEDCKGRQREEDVRRLIFHNTSIPDGNAKKFNVIAIPDTVARIPEWLMEYIDYDRIVNSITGSFQSVLEVFNIKSAEFGTAKTHKSNAPMNIIKL
jgi:hypothetical protein